VAVRGRRLSSVPWLALVFILLALGETVRVVRDADLGSNATIDYFVVFILGLAPAIASILLPAALLIRHPNALRVVPALLLGAILVAAVQGLQLLIDPLQPVFESLTPATEELPDFVPLAALFRVFTFVVLFFGLGFISLGLSAARRFEDPTRDLTSLFVPVATVLATIAGVVEISRLGLFDVAMSPTYLLFLGTILISGILQVAIWAYVLAVTTRGWRAGEAPGVGWRFGVLSGTFVLGAFAMIYGSRIFDLDAALGDLLFYAVTFAYAVGYLSLLVAFGVGLPEIDQDDQEDEDADEDEEADEVEELLDEGGWPIATGPGG
jgi:hypothetical protein